MASNEVVGFFGSMSVEGLTADTGSWYPPNGNYDCFLKDIIGSKMEWVDKDTGQAMSKPQVSFRFEIASGHFAGKTFLSDRMTVQPWQSSPTPDLQEMQKKTLNRLLGIFNTALGYEITDFNSGATALVAELEANPDGIPVTVNVWESNKENKKGFKNRSVKAIRRWDTDVSGDPA